MNRFGERIANVPGMPFGWIGQTAKTVAHQGVDVFPALNALHVGGGIGPLDDASIMRPEDSILMAALVINGVGDEMHGVVGKPLSCGTSALMVQAAATATDLLEVINSFVRFFALISGDCDISFKSEAINSSIVIRTNAPDTQARYVAEEMYCLFLHAQLSNYLGFFLPLLSFKTPARDHPLVSRNHSYFLCPVARGNETALTFPTSYLAFHRKSALKANLVLHGELQWLSFHDEIARGTFNRQLDEDTFGSAVYRLLSDNLISLDACCAALSLSERQLRYRLWQEGTTFRQIRRAALLGRSGQELSEGACADDLANDMHYSDARSLRRALKNAGRVSISEMRGGLRSSGRESAVMERLRAEVRRLA